MSKSKPKFKLIKGPRILFLDIETKPILAHVWSIWQQNVGLNQIQSDWSILSFAARWAHDPKGRVSYFDLSKTKDFENDVPLLKQLWKLLDQADIVIAQNGVAFDKKKVFARFVQCGFSPPSPFKMLDTKIIAKKIFGFTSNRLEYLSDKLAIKHKKLKHEKYPGHELWSECLKGNQDAWAHMRKYNITDVLALEEVYEALRAWMDDPINFGLYHEGNDPVCRCGSTEFERRGYHFTQAGKFQRYCCVECGAWTRGRTNLLSPDKRANIHLSTPR